MDTDKVIRGLIAKVEQMTDTMFELLSAVQDVQQRQKQMQYTISQGKNEDVHVPKGEKDTVLCDSCGGRMHVRDVMKRTRDIEGKIVIFDICRKCFYRK